MAQWEIARLEAEARLVREAKFVIPNPINSLSKDSLLALPPLNKQQPMVPPCLDILKASERSSWADINLNFNVGTLLSPNSVLMPPFPDNMNFITAAASASASVSPRLDNYAQKGNEVEGTIEMQEIMGSFSDQVDFGDQSFSLGIPNSRLMEFPDEFLLSDNCCVGGYLEDNKYWN
ncbi:hypothetical protein M9H77_09943 [Catharanthus roseus]|uniref:Uncharacterized protein n=2 Tax=Catharanthus roseus TaxID=4058 RepID=A0ACC0C269_CATRO|nr:hypothetical protein M9H77_09942 [Catharanthus roseus]KAI5678993.1 hypothetical protein M9H77_09943 [Catharanthus roseus]